MTKRRHPEALQFPLLVLFLLSALQSDLRAQSPTESSEFRTAVALYERGLYWESESAFRKVTERFSDFGQGWFGLAMCHYETRRLEASLAFFEKAEGCPAPEAQAFTNHAVALELLSRPEVARRLLERAVAIDAGHANAWLNLGKLAARRADGKAARRHLDRCLALEPRNVEALLQRATLDLRDGRSEDVRKALEVLQRLRPDGVAVAHLAARLARRDGDRAKARRLLARWRQLHDEAEAATRRAAKVSSLHALAFAALRGGRTGEAVTYFAEVLSVDPADRQAASTLKGIARKLMGSKRPGDRALLKRISDLQSTSKRP